MIENDLESMSELDIMMQLSKMYVDIDKKVDSIVRSQAEAANLVVETMRRVCLLADRVSAIEEE